MKCFKKNSLIVLHLVKPKKAFHSWPPILLFTLDSLMMEQRKHSNHHLLTPLVIYSQIKFGAMRRMENVFGLTASCRCYFAIQFARHHSNECSNLFELAHGNGGLHWIGKTELSAAFFSLSLFVSIALIPKLLFFSEQINEAVYVCMCFGFSFKWREK